MKKTTLRILCLLLAAAVLTGCGAKLSTESAGNSGVALDKESGGDYIYGSVSDSATSDTAASESLGQKLIKTVTMRAETEDLDALLAALSDHITALGGYTEFQNVYNGSAYSTRRYRSAELTIRVPADRLGEFVTHVEQGSNVISKTESIDDVTLEYVDTESRLKALQAEQDRLLELMDQAGDLSDLLQIEARLTEVRYELESVASRLRVLENLVSYATIELQVDEVEVYTEVEKQTVWQRIGSGFTQNLHGIGEDLTDFFVWLVTYSPQLIVTIAALALLVTLARRAVRRRRKKNAPPPAAEN